MVLRRLRVPAICWMGMALIGPQAWADGRPEAEILGDIRAVVFPDPPDNRSSYAVRTYRAGLRKAEDRRADLIRELFKSHPESAELVSLLPDRWMILVKLGALKTAEATREADEVLAGNFPEPLRVGAAYFKAGVASSLVSNRSDLIRALAAIDAFAELAPRDNRAADLLIGVARATRDPARKAEIERRVARDYPDSKFTQKVERDKKAEQHLAEAIGKPFELEFKDAITGRTVSMKDLKGKVVVIDFWATWCAPCIQEMPKMQDLYDQYRGRGVEFIGVSLDRPEEKGGLEALRQFVEKQGVLWPQYYQGNGWESEFSSSWEVRAIPTVFLIDADGNLFATDVRGRLPVMIPMLLERAGFRRDRP